MIKTLVILKYDGVFNIVGPRARKFVYPRIEADGRVKTMIPRAQEVFERLTILIIEET
jgi:hypothetical protein